MKTPFDLTGKTILVTGASSGIGRQTCISIANMGGKIIASGRNEERLKETITMLPEDKHKMFKADLTKTSEIEEMVNDLDKINGVVHCAGIVKLLPMKFYTKEYLREVNEINYEVPVLLTKTLHKKRKILNNSSIIFISSIMSQVGKIGQGLYAGTKGALVAITKVIALELAAKNIRVNCISPGLVKTPLIDLITFKKEIEENIKLHPLGLGDPEDVANACVYLLSDASRWITGTNLIIDGGYCAQ
ncbi:MAG: SDR family oxidoreductase [Deltaproteobacteria bacterium]|jgi:NAD(P)-dependent dehydrogenase (short-subunit alcohol dehydrogenase family)|nr:SDR family oxidoreductase [Deltaproteobacteria bacterium]